MNSIQNAFAAAGLLPEDVAFDLAIAKYLNSGGTIERAHARLVVAAERMPEMGQFRNDAKSAPEIFAQIRQQDEDGAATVSMPDNGRDQVAAPSSFNRGKGSHPRDVQEHHVRIAPLVREPSSDQRTIAGIIAKVTAVTVLDTLKIDGRAIGDWTVAEARAAGKTKTREGRILIEASRMVANAPSNALIRNVVKADELQVIMQKAAEISDAA